MNASHRPIIGFVAALLFVLAGPGCDRDPGEQPDPGPVPSGPPSWESATVERQWSQTGIGEPFELLALAGGEQLIVGGRRLARLDSESLPSQHPTWKLTWPEDPTTMLGLEVRWPSRLAAFDATGDGEEEILVLETKNAYLVSASTGEILRRDVVGTKGIWPFALTLLGEGEQTSYAVAAGNLAVHSGTTGELLWDARFEDWAFAVTSARLDSEGRGLVVGLEVSEIDLSGVVTVPKRPAVFGFSETGEQLFDFIPFGMVWSIASGDLAGDGLDDVLVGTDASRVHALAADGTPLWTANLGDGIVRDILVEDVTGDGRAEILAAVTDPYLTYSTTVVALDSDGNELWRRQGGAEYARIQLHRLESGERILVSSCRDYWTLTLGSMVVWDPVDGTELWRTTGSFTSELVRIDGVELLAHGGSDTRVHVANPLTGEPAVSHTGGLYIAAVTVADLDGDGVDEIVTGDEVGRLAAYDVAGVRLWEAFLERTIITDVAAAVLRPGEGVSAVGVGIGGTGDNRGWVQIHDSEGARLAARGSTARMFWEVELVDLNGDGELEILAAASTGLDTPCYLVVFDARARILGEVQLPTCFIPNISVIQPVDGGAPSVAVMGMRFMGPSWAGVVEADLEVRWMQNLEYVADWMGSIEGDLVLGGATGGGVLALGDFATRLSGSDASEKWRYVGEPVPERESRLQWGAFVPGAGSDEGAAFALGSSTNHVHLIDAATGHLVWVAELEPFDTPEQYRRGTGALAYIPGTDISPPWLAVAGFGDRLEADSYALDLEGRVIGAFPNEGSGGGAAALRTGPGRMGAALSAGLGLNLIEAVLLEP